MLITIDKEDKICHNLRIIINKEIKDGKTRDNNPFSSTHSKINSMGMSMLENIINSKELLKNETSIRILHNNETYVLRVTKTNKLILTK